MKTGKYLTPDDFPDKLTADWLTLKTTVAEVEARHERNEWFDAEWPKFTAQIEVGDEVWEFSTPRRYWNVGFGSAGYVIVRRGIEVARMTTKMN